ncbi:hypothetical protein [Salegentibacter sediminis]|uniref:hypothetical protein n=1 Tax=Salegentibacter sediminis TaxID=1930251 RepID=UPI0012FF901A|nr:hypothetical protein [Salegentibacter sediminis]
MRFNQSLLIVFAMGLISCDSDDYPYANIPSVVLNKFEMHYPKAQEADFKKKDKLYEVSFEIEEVDYKADIDEIGSIRREKYETAINEFPKEVTGELLKTYDTVKLKKPEILRNADGVYFQVKLDRLFKDELIVLDKEGKTLPNINYWK